MAGVRPGAAGACQLPASRPLTARRPPASVRRLSDESRLPVEALQNWPEGFLLKVRDPARGQGLGAACKPGSVPMPGCPDAGEDHSSRPTIAGRLEHSHPDTAPGPKSRRSSGPLSTMSLFEFAPGGACPAAGHPAVARGLLPHDFNLACASTAGPLTVAASPAIGGVVSVALSLESPRVAVNDLPALRSPDFPPAGAASRSPPLRPAILRPPPARPKPTGGTGSRPIRCESTGGAGRTAKRVFLLHSGCFSTETKFGTLLTISSVSI